MSTRYISEMNSNALQQPPTPAEESPQFTNKIYNETQIKIARQRRRLIAFYLQWAPTVEAEKKVQVLLERHNNNNNNNTDNESAALFDALYEKYKVPEEEQIYGTVAQRRRRRKITAFFSERGALLGKKQKQQEKEKKQNQEGMIEAAMEMDGSVDIVLRRLRKKYPAEVTETPSVNNNNNNNNNTAEKVVPPPQESKLEEVDINSKENKKKSALRNRLTEFYAKHCPEEVEEKVKYAMSLNVEENVLFTSLHRRYNLDIDGNPLPSLIKRRSKWASDEENVKSLSSEVTGGEGVVLVMTEKETLRNRLIAFYEKHSPLNMEAKVQRALALDVDEVELFRALHRQYHLDENGEPITKAKNLNELQNLKEPETSNKTISIEEVNSDNANEKNEDTTNTVISEVEPVVLVKDNEAKTDDEIIIMTDNYTTLEEIEKVTPFETTVNNELNIINKTVLSNNSDNNSNSIKSVKGEEVYVEVVPVADSTSNNSSNSALIAYNCRYESLKEFFTDLDPEKKEAFLQQWMPSELSDDELLQHVRKLQEDEQFHSLAEPLFAQEEILPQITSTYEEKSKGQFKENEKYDNLSIEEKSIPSSDIFAKSNILLFSRHIHCFSGYDWHIIPYLEMRDAVLEDFAACTKFPREDFDATLQFYNDGVRVTFFIAYRNPAAAQAMTGVVESVIFHSTQRLLHHYQHEQQKQKQQEREEEEEEEDKVACVTVRCRFTKLSGAILRHAADARRALFARALEVDLLAHAVRSGASHLLMGPHLSLRQGAGLEVQAGVSFPSEHAAAAYLRGLLNDNEVNCREARRVYASLGGDPHDVAFATVDPITPKEKEHYEEEEEEGGGGKVSKGVSRESQLLAREKELESRLQLLEEREAAIRRHTEITGINYGMECKETPSIGTRVMRLYRTDIEEQAIHLASEVRAKLAGR